MSGDWQDVGEKLDSLDTPSNGQAISPADFARLELQVSRALLFFCLPLRAYLVARVILAYSYGLERAVATFLSRAIFLAETGLDKADVSKAEAFLVENHMLTARGAHRGIQVYEFHPYWSNWSCDPRRSEWSDKQLLRTLIGGTHPIQAAAREACRSNQPELLPPEPSFNEMLVALERESVLGSTGGRRDLLAEASTRLEAGKLQQVGRVETSPIPVFRRPAHPEPVSETGQPARVARETAATRQAVDDTIEYAGRKLGAPWIHENRGLIIALVTEDRAVQKLREAISDTADFKRTGRKFRTTETRFLLGRYHALRGPDRQRMVLRTSATPQETGT
jgi:hypothetical protein